MPTVRKLTPDEVRTIENRGKGTRKLVEEQYDTFLSDYGVGDYGEAELDAGEKRLTVRSRLKRAAARRGMTLEFYRTRGSTIRFKVIAAGQSSSAAAPAAAVEPVRRRGGRTRKVTA